VKGKVTNTKIIKQTHYSKFKGTTIEDVFVLSIEGTSDQFGFAQFTDPFKYLLTSRVVGKTAEIYYDAHKNGIQGNVFFPSEIKIDEIKIVSMEETKRWKRNGAIFFLSLSVLLITLVLFGIKRKQERF
jgi:hypothetical protein